jgi:hypothetical protein
MPFALVPTLLLTLAAMLIAWLAVCSRRWNWWTRGVHALADRRALTLAVVGVWGFATSATTAWYRPHFLISPDEFCYLLAADTFAQGRWTNPAPPEWKHFETHNTLVHPTYQAKYPPIQGLLLAVGQVTTGQPRVGVWLSMGLAAAAAAWCVYGLAAPRWGLIAGLLTAVHPMIHHFGIFSWTQAYWGGCGAFIGGCLLYGGWFRLERRRSWTDGIALGVGLLILANSRPYEGLLVSLPVLVVLVRWWLRRPTWAERAVVGPMLAVLLVGAGLMVTYWTAVTGSPGQMPYTLYEHKYSSIPLFWWNALKAPAEPECLPGWYAHLDQLAGPVYFAHYYPDGGINWPNAIKLMSEKLRANWYFFGQPWLLLMLPAMMFGLHLRRGRLLLAGMVLVLAGLLGIVWLFPHYAAPMSGLVLAFALLGARVVRAGRPRIPFLNHFLWLGTGTLVVGLTLQMQIYEELDLRPEPWYERRLEVEAWLREQPGPHLVILTYGPKPDFRYDFVYNSANFATAPILFARSLGPERDVQLRAAFPTRRVWRVQADAPIVQVEPYP